MNITGLTSGGGHATPYNSPRRYRVSRDEEGLVEILSQMGAHIFKEYNFAWWEVECDEITWAHAQVSYTVTGFDYGHAQVQNVPPPHKCLAEKCSDSHKQFYEGVLNYHKMSKPDTKVHECGNTICLIEQYKKHDKNKL